MLIERGSVEGDDELTYVLNSLEKGWIGLLQQIRIFFECEPRAERSFTHLGPRISRSEGLEHQSGPSL